jgi:hypothetical protein
MTTKELTNRSNTIVIGKVKSMKAQWGNGGTKIYTYITVSVEDCLKGNKHCPEVTIRQEGGEVGGIGLKVVGAPEYKEGEDVLTFLEEYEPDHFKCVGMMQGKYTVEEDYVTKKKILVGGHDRLEKRGLNLGASKKDMKKKLFLDDFISQIKTIIDEEKEGR